MAKRKPDQYDIYLKRGEPWQFKFRRKDADGNPIDWTAHEPIAQWRNPRSNELIFDFSVANGNVDISDAVDFYAVLDLSSDETQELDEGVELVWELWIVTMATGNRRPYLSGRISIEDTVYEPED